MRLSREPAQKNNRLSRREKCDLITEKSIITVFNVCKLFATAIFAVPCRRIYVFFVCIYKTHLLSLPLPYTLVHTVQSCLSGNAFPPTIPVFRRPRREHLPRSSGMVSCQFFLVLPLFPSGAQFITCLALL